MSLVKFTNARKTFKNTVAIDDISFSVKAGEVLGFLGPNGAGKTTSLRSLMDFIHLDSGSIEIFGQDSHKKSVELKRRIGYLPADHHLYDNWTGEQHLKFISELRNVQENDQSLIKLLDIDLKKNVKQLSTGNKQKLSLVLTFIGQPELLLLDEPTQGLDPVLQNDFYELVTNYQKNGGTVLMSSHNLAEVERLCERVVIINKGRVVAEDNLESLKSKNIHQVTVVFDTAPSKIALPDGCDIISQLGNTLSFKTKGSLNKVLEQLTKHRIRDIAINHVGLEEIFLEYYHD